MKQIIITLLLISISISLFGQKHTITEMARDTIVDVRYGFSNRYFLDNKLMNTPVMMWFMQEYEQPHKNIVVANIMNSVGSAYLALGGTMIVLGATIRADDKALSNTLYQVGGIGVGAAFIFYYVGERYKKKAVRQYNSIVLDQCNKRYGLSLTTNQNGVGMKLEF